MSSAKSKSISLEVGVERGTPPSKLKEAMPTANDWLEHSNQLLSKHTLEAGDWISWALIML